MRRSLPLTALLVGLLLLSDVALAVRSGGHNPPTRKLEIAFKVVGGLRAASKDGCYPAPRRLARVIRKYSDPEATVAAGLGSVDRREVVHVVRRHTHCNNVRLALRARGHLFILDTAGGEVYKRGQRDRQNDETRRGGLGPLRSLTLVEKSFTLKAPDRAKRLLVLCPRGTFPLGGGMTTSPPVGGDGEGVYPHSYERLGVQRGYHITALVIDPTPRRTARRETTIQTVCGRGLVPKSSVRSTVFVRRHETNTAIARCPEGEQLFSGGFQRTNFTTPKRTYGGNYITESRAIGTEAWQVTATSTGHDGGELTAIAHCGEDESLPLTEVSASAPLFGGLSATATTSPCPPGMELTAGGFSFNGSQQAFFAEGRFNPDNTWSATGFGFFGPAPDLTAYGYCLEASEA